MNVAPEPDHVIELTRAWCGARLPDGRPRVPDAVLDRLHAATTERAWGVLRYAGYHLQLSGQWLDCSKSERLLGLVPRFSDGG